MCISLLNVSIGASELDMTKQEMRRNEPTPSSEIVSMEEPQQSLVRRVLPIVFAVTIIMVLVVLLSTFVSRYALSVRDKNNSVYEKSPKLEEQDQDKQ